jgi:putative membrane protein
MIRPRAFTGLNVSMIIRLAVRLVVLAAIIGVVARIVPGIHVRGGFAWLLWLALLFSVVNLIVGPVFRLLSLPLIVLTLGLFLLVVNAGLLAITAGLSAHLDVDDFGSAVLGGFLIALFSWLAELLLPVVRLATRRRPASSAPTDAT